MHKGIIIANGIGLIIIAAFLGYAIYIKEATAPVVETTDIQEGNSQMIDGASVSFSETIEKPEDLILPGFQETKKLLADKFKKRPDEIQLSVADNERNYIRGNTIIGKDIPENRGIVFSSDVNGQW